MYFNSRPHEEVDNNAACYQLPIYIFQLTTSRRGRLCCHFCHIIYLVISTHDLTKRSTTTWQLDRRQKGFQLTTSRRGRPGFFSVALIVFTFQLTTSRRGRQAFELMKQGALIFQLTTSRRGRPFWIISVVCNKVFQLTTSRRGRRDMLRPQARLNLYFNSRPHEEVDAISAGVILSLVISTHDLTKRSTLSCAVQHVPTRYFNSRPHEEVDNLRT